jgi:hypothetical protein
MATKNSTRKVLVYCTVIAMALGMVFVILLITGVISGDSDTEELMSIPNLSGMEFKVIYTSRARLVVTDYAISIYARRAASKEESLFAKWLNRQTLLFRYDPGSDTNNLPTINASGNDRILISIPTVSSVSFQNRKWQNMTIDYNIGNVLSP